MAERLRSGTVSRGSSIARAAVSRTRRNANQNKNTKEKENIKTQYIAPILTKIQKDSSINGIIKYLEVNELIAGPKAKPVGNALNVSVLRKPYALPPINVDKLTPEEIALIEKIPVQITMNHVHLMNSIIGKLFKYMISIIADVETTYSTLTSEHGIINNPDNLEELKLLELYRVAYFIDVLTRLLELEYNAQTKIMYIITTFMDKINNFKTKDKTQQELLTQINGQNAQDFPLLEQALFNVENTIIIKHLIHFIQKLKKLLGDKLVNYSVETVQTAVSEIRAAHQHQYEQYRLKLAIEKEQAELTQQQAQKNANNSEQKQLQARLSELTKLLEGEKTSNNSNNSNNSRGAAAANIEVEQDQSDQSKLADLLHLGKSGFKGLGNLLRLREKGKSKKNTRLNPSLLSAESRNAALSRRANNIAAAKTDLNKQYQERRNSLLPGLRKAQAARLAEKKSSRKNSKNG